MITENAVEEKLLLSIRRLTNEQKKNLLSFIDSFSIITEKNNYELSGIVNQIREEAAKNQLTEETLNEILSEKN